MQDNPMQDNTIHILAARELDQVSGGFFGGCRPGLWPPVARFPGLLPIIVPIPAPLPPRPRPGPVPYPFWPGPSLLVLPA